MNRRQFGKAAAFTALSYSRVLGANDRVQMGFIGLGNRGDQVHEGFLEYADSRTVAICDLREDYLDFASAKSRSNPKRYADYRKLLEDKDVEAVAIASPDHWHALMFVDACRAAKDVYVEKPLSLTVSEGRRMVQVAQETKRVVQVGIQRRSSKFLQEAVEYLKAGALGKISVARGFHVQNEAPNGIGNASDSAPPSPEMWDKWLGPAPKVPYNKNRTFYNFRWFYDYSGGQITNFGVHYMDMLRWALGKQTPRAVVAIGGKYGVSDNREIPDTCEVHWDFGDMLMGFVQYNANAAPASVRGAEMEIRGTLGTMYIYSNRWEVVPEKTTEVLFGARTPLDRNSERAYNPSKKATIEAKVVNGTTSTPPHCRNFLDCVKSRARTNCPIEEGHTSTANTVIAHIALRTRSFLEWDGKAERFTNSEAANRYLSYRYRAPYRLG
ncbi:MAG: Gfo/Idh/MocA family oxidoreductase [Acidobacteria bacterium]|nr:Gfo/Idh/MocA family oxidoreductase [Acidobacteriota bacterium]